MDAKPWIVATIVFITGAALAEDVADDMAELYRASAAPEAESKPTPEAEPKPTRLPEVVGPEVGRPLPELELAVSDSPQPGDELEPPLPGELVTPAWLLPPEESTIRSDLAEAFNLEGVAIGKGSPHVDSNVRPASAELPVDPRLPALKATLEQLAKAARSIGDLDDIIEQCGANDKRFPCTANQRALATIASWAFNRRGELYAAQGNDHAAYDDYDRAISVDADNAMAHHNRGLTLAQYGRMEAALADFNQAIEVDPSLAIGYGNRGELLMAMGRNQQAEADFARAIELAPKQASHYTGRAAARRALGRRAEAVRDLNQAILLAPEDASAYAERGALYAHFGYHEQAVADFDAALKADPYCVAAYQSLAWLLSTCPEPRYRDSKKALEAGRRALRLGNPEDPMLLDTVAAAHASAGLMGEAVRLEQQAVLLATPDLREVFSERLALYRAGRAHRQPAVR